MSKSISKKIVKLGLLMMSTLVALSLASCDSGTWELTKILANKEIPEGTNRASFYNDDFGVVYNEITAYTTVDGGANWTHEEQIDGLCIDNIEILKDGEFIMGSCCTGLYYTDSNRDVFTRPMTGGITHSFSFLENGDGWFGSGRKILNFDQDKVDLKDYIEIPGSSKLQTVHKATESVGYAVDQNNNFFKTMDGGLIWDKSIIDFGDETRALGSYLLTDFRFMGENDIRIMTYGRNRETKDFTWFYITSLDGGESWELEEVGIDALPGGVPSFSLDGSRVTITPTAKADTPESPSIFVLQNKMDS